MGGDIVDEQSRRWDSGLEWDTIALIHFAIWKGCACDHLKFVQKLCPGTIKVKFKV